MTTSSGVLLLDATQPRISFETANEWHGELNISRKSRAKIVNSYVGGVNRSRSVGFTVSRAKSLSPYVTRVTHGIGEDYMGDYEAIIHTIKASIGNGVLSLPKAVADAGLLMGTACTFACALTVIFAMQLLVRTAQFIKASLNLEPGADMDYVQTVRETIALLPEHIARKLQWCPAYLRISVLASQFGFLAVYVIFVADNAQRFIREVGGPDISALIFQVAFSILVIPACFVRNLNSLAKFNTLANIAVLYCLTMIMVCCVTDRQNIMAIPWIKTWKTIPFFFGVIIFSFESINLVLPIENRMRNPERFPGRRGGLALAMTCVVCVDTAIGFYGYLRFGEDISTSIAYNIPLMPFYYAPIKPLFIFVIYISYVMQFYVAHTVLMESIEDKVNNCRFSFIRNHCDVLLQLVIIAIPLLLAVSIPQVDIMISLVGSICGSFVSLLYPPFLYSIVLWHQKANNWKLWIVRNIAIMIFGILGGIVGTYVSIVQLIERY